MNEKITKMKSRFYELCSEIKRDGVEKLLDWLENSDFFSCPASTKYHGNYEGGLLEHSLDVYDELIRISNIYPEVKLSRETAIIISLFHDLCKVNFYVSDKRNRKNDQGRWETYDCYTIKEAIHYGGHGSKSVYILQNFIKLSAEEAVAINCHMSCWGNDDKSVGDAYEQFPIAWMLHVADEASTFILNRKENNQIG